MKISALAALGGVSGVRIVGASIAHAEEREWRHGLSLFGELKYPPNFPHFDYVNPQAPKGGKLRLYALGSFDSLNPYTYSGESTGIAVNNEALFTASLDEPSTEYGLVADVAWHAEDYSQAIYRLRPEARFHDGKQISVEDAIWSMETLKQTHPFYVAYYKNVVKTEQAGENEVAFFFSEKGNRELPQIVGQLPVLPKHWWTGTKEDGSKRDIQSTTLEIPLGSGPYKCVDVKPGRLIRLARVQDYWGKDLPVNVGQDNFDEISYEFYLDTEVAFEAFKADRYDFRLENTAKTWATGYGFPAVKSGKVVQEKIATKNAEPMQCFVLNLRKAKFQDPRVRLAFNYAFDFDWANTNLFYGEYTRTASFFANSELAATGLPSEAELRFLADLKDKVPPEVFTTEFKNPVNPDRTQRRNNLRAAAQLLQEAGWTQQKDGQETVLKNALGEILAAEFLLDQPSYERIVIPYTQELNKLGVRARVRTIDSAQMTRRTQDFDFDVIWTGWAQSLSPGNEQREFWGSEAADRKGSRNYAGIKDKAIDTLIERLIFAKSREELVAACKALDRVLLWNHFVVPMWHVPYERVARWDRFGKPEKLPDYSIGFPSIWWWDKARAEKIAQG
jgi:microcin C transport system substrate-binding protein